MDGIHDLGGKQGYGPIDVTAPDFAQDWERRQWALSQTMTAPPCTIDWWRHTVECLMPRDYMTMPYFQKWTTTEMALNYHAGVFTLSELVSGQSATPAPDVRAEVYDIPALLEQQRGQNHSFAVPVERPPRFALGDTVVTNRHAGTGHTRLPAYARAATGTIVAHHGGHAYPDACAHAPDRAAGPEQDLAHHLYTVEFTAAMLWPETAHPEDTVRLDLWEPYLAHP